MEPGRKSLFILFVDYFYEERFFVHREWIKLCNEVNQGEEARETLYNRFYKYPKKQVEYRKIVLLQEQVSTYTEVGLKIYHIAWINEFYLHLNLTCMFSGQTIEYLDILIDKEKKGNRKTRLKIVFGVNLEYILWGNGLLYFS